jgi:recombination protein RecT
LRDLAPFLTKPKQAFCAAGGTEQKFAQEVNFAMQAMLNNPYLVTCAKSDPDHLVEAIKNVGLTGLSLNPELRLGYLVPYKGKIKFQSSYMGKIEILIRSGIVKDIYAELVYEKDQFVYRKGNNGTLEHTPNVFTKDRGAVVGGYYYAVLATGQVKYDVMPVDRIEEIKNRSESVKSGKASPWSTDENEMMRKTIINWAFKFLPKSGISESMLKVLETEAEFEREEFEDWKKAQEIKQADSFKDDGKFTEFEEVSAN